MKEKIFKTTKELLQYCQLRKLFLSNDGKIYKDKVVFATWDYDTEKQQYIVNLEI